jgi:hypothetical protein
LIMQLLTQVNTIRVSSMPSQWSNCNHRIVKEVGADT